MPTYTRNPNPSKVETIEESAREMVIFADHRKRQGDTDVLVVAMFEGYKLEARPGDNPETIIADYYFRHDSTRARF